MKKVNSCECCVCEMLLTGIWHCNNSVWNMMNMKKKENCFNYSLMLFIWNSFGIYNNFKWPVTWSIRAAGAGPTAKTVFELGAICVRPASRMRHVLRLLSRAALNTAINSSSLSTLTTILALPESSQRRTRFGKRFMQFWYAPTAAWPHCAPIFPFPIFKSFRTTNIIFKSLPSEYT